MLSKSKIKFIKSLNIKKFRDEEACFVAEGEKLVRDLTAGFTCTLLLTSRHQVNSQEWIQAEEVIEVTEEEMMKVTNQKHPQGVLGVFRIRKQHFDIQILRNELVLMLDEVQDPGNLGTIIRIADWFGIRHIVCSPHSADAYGPKTVQATMGALSRVQVHYTDLVDFLRALPGDIPVYGTFLSGKNIYDEVLSENGIILMGNEGNGISASVAQMVTHQLLIPGFPEGSASSESLNVGVATAIVCSEFRRRLRVKPAMTY